MASLPPSLRSRGVTAVLGPTNTGKTHFAIERMLGHPSGMIGLPLRLLAREVYGRVVDRVGAPAVALITGEEKIKPPGARYWICTVESMPRDIDVSFLAIDEIQLCSDLDRGHVFTDRLLNMRGLAETLVIGADTMRPIIQALLPGVTISTRPRLSQLLFAGDKKISRLPRRSAIVAFSADEVYAIAELIRRQSGGAAVVLGALSPRTRNAQVALYQSGDVDYLVATDAIGMGLNLDVDHVAFAGDRKFDGTKFRRLMPAEFGQIAGRAGRHMRDGTFGTTGRVEPFDDELVEAIEGHQFDPIPILQWRNPDLDFSTLSGLITSLDRVPTEQGLTRVPLADDVRALETVARDPALRPLATTREMVRLLWDVCQVPDYRKVSPQAHADLVGTLYDYLARRGKIPVEWFARQLAEVNRTDGDIDTLSARIAQVRTWTFVANRNDWLANPEHWQGEARQIEDALSDALHERLAQRFVDRRTSVLMRRLRENAMLEAEITPTGDVLVEAHHVGRLQGFQFVPDSDNGATEGKALRAAALKALQSEFEQRATRVANAVDDAFVLANDGALRFTGEVIAKLVAGEKILTPKWRILADDHLSAPDRDKVQARIDLWLKAHIEKLLGPLLKLEEPAELTGLARGIAFQIAEALGVLDRARVADDVKTLDQDSRAALRALGVRFGAYHLTVPALLKPAPRALAAQLWALREGGDDVKGLDDIVHLAASGRTSIPVNHDAPKDLYRAAGFRVCGNRAVRVDILERLADLIRPAIQYRPGVTPGDAPQGAADGDGFVVTLAMTSLCGCAGEDFGSILKSLGYVAEKRKGPAITVPLLPAASTTPVGAEIASAATVDATSDIPNETPDMTAAAEAASSDADVQVVETPVVEASREIAPAADAQLVDTQSDTVEAGSAAGQEPPAEPELIEIWRQHRGHHGQRQHRGKPRHQPHAKSQPQAKAQDAKPGDAPAQEGGARPDRNKDRRDFKRKDGDERSNRPFKKDEKRAEGGRPSRDERSHRPRHGRDDKRDHVDRGWQDPPKPRDSKAIDPDSPFAKLMALKADLETKAKG